MAKRDNKQATPTEPPSDELKPSRKANTGRELAAAKKRGTAPKASPAEQRTRVATASAKKGKSRKALSADSAPLLTAERALVARRGQAIVSAFLTAEKLRGGVRKLSRPQWASELETFTQAPR